MVYRGKREGFYLYEVTESDLILETQDQAQYHVGNVVLFSDKNDISLGRESAKADDFATALEYLSEKSDISATPLAYESEYLASLKRQLQQSEADVRKRDELLYDVTSQLDSQRYSNQMLIAQIANLREQMSIEQITRDEVISDLEVASAETFRMDQELQETLEAKMQLEQELAARICDLLELDSEKEELQKRLSENGSDEAAVQASEDAEHKSDKPNIQENNTLDTSSATGRIRDTEVITLPSGKQIQINHEFPAAKPAKQQSAARIVLGAARVLVLIIIALVVFVAGSVVATAHFNNLSFGEALDVILKNFLP